MLGFIRLPPILIYLSGVGIIEPVLRFFGLYGRISLLLPALAVCIASFTVYGWLLAAIASLFYRGVKQQ